MSSFNKRKQLVNQLRKAHFPFGFESTKYPEYKISSYQEPNGNARRNNFSIGNQNDVEAGLVGAPCSEFKEKFPNYNVKGKEEAIGAKHLGVNNIVFGYDKRDDAYGTNYKDQFNKKENTTNRVKPGDLKKNNIEFGDSLTDFATTYTRVYDNKPLQQNNKINVVEKDGRKSNLMLGNDKSSFQTQNLATYKYSMNGPNNYHSSKQTNNASNIQLGNQNIDYASENKQRFAISTQDQQQRIVVPKQTIRDFRSAHFQFGFPEQKINVESQAKAQYGEKPLQVVHVDGRKPSNINLNVDGNVYFESMYKNSYENWGTQPRNQISKKGRIDNVLIGTDNDPSQRYISQAKQNFGQKPISRVQPYKLSATIQLGQQKPDFSTHNQMTYDNKFPARQNNKVTQQDINKIKKLNVVTGFQNNDYNLHSKQYGKQLGERGQLSKETLSKMKNTNIVFQTVVDVSKIEGVTSYRTAYPYKVNVQ